MKFLLFILAMMFNQYSFSQPISSQDSVLVKIGDYKITIDEFQDALSEYSSMKNINKNDFNDQKNFLDTYVNYKLKIFEAYELKYNLDTEVQKDYQDFLQQISSSEYSTKNFVDDGLRKLYNNRKKEYRVKHILLTYNKGHKEEAKILAYNIIKKILNGANFEKLAKEYSKDIHTNQRGGDIGYFTAGETLKAFEDVVMKLKPNTVSLHPVETKFGYHVVKLISVRDRIPEIRASHILIKVPKDATKEENDSAFEKLKSIRKRIVNGESFAELAKQFSEDGSASKGGDLGFFGRRRMVPPFDEAAFNLKINEVSEIIKTRFGYHIIKLTDIKKLSDFDSEKKNLESIYKRAYYQYDYINHLNSLYKKYNVVINKKLIKTITNRVKDLPLRLWSEVDESKVFNDSLLINFNGHNYSVGKVIQYSMRVIKNKDLIISVKSLMIIAQNFCGSFLINEELKSFVEERPKLKLQANKYLEGLMIYKIQTKNIWNNIHVDSLEILNEFKNNASNYFWNDRVEYAEILTKSKAKIDEIYKEVSDGIPFDSLAEKYTQRVNMKEKKGVFSLRDVNSSEVSKLANELTVEGEIAKPQKISVGWVILKLIAKDKARNKTYLEAKPFIINYLHDLKQNKNNKSYIDKLKTKYKPKFFYENLKYAF